MNQGLIFLEAVLAIEIIPIAPVLLERSNEKLVDFFPALKSTSHFLPQSTVSHRSDSLKILQMLSIGKYISL